MPFLRLDHTWLLATIDCGVEDCASFVGKVRRHIFQINNEWSRNLISFWSQMGGKSLMRYMELPKSPSWGLSGIKYLLPEASVFPSTHSTNKAGFTQSLMLPRQGSLKNSVTSCSTLVWLKFAYILGKFVHLILRNACQWWLHYLSKWFFPGFS